MMTMFKKKVWASRMGMQVDNKLSKTSQGKRHDSKKRPLQIPPPDAGKSRSIMNRYGFSNAITPKSFEKSVH